jgi:hypothetical protein
VRLSSDARLFRMRAKRHAMAGRARVYMEHAMLGRRRAIDQQRFQARMVGETPRAAGWELLRPPRRPAPVPNARKPDLTCPPSHRA